MSPARATRGRPRRSAEASLLDAACAAVAHPGRRAILDLLAQQGPLSSGRIAMALPQATRQAVVAHLRALRQAELIWREPQGYRLTPQPLTLVRDWVERYRSFWTDKLEELAGLAEEPAAVPAAAVKPEPQNGVMPNLPPLPMRQPQPVILSGQRVQLVPLSEQSLPFITDAVQYRDLWALSTTAMSSAEHAAEYLAVALRTLVAGTALPFGILVTQDDGADRHKVFAGSTRFGSIDAKQARLEIGWTWLLPQFQRTGVNREAKLLLLTHAFEDLGARRVEFKCDARNAKSRAGLLGIGATFEGTLRRHMVLPDGTPRDSCYFSIIAEEWPAVKAKLVAELAR